MSNLPTVTQRGSVRARISRKVPGPRAQTLKPSAPNPDGHITLGKSFNSPSLYLLKREMET